MERSCNILAVDDHPMLRAGLRQTLLQRPELALVGEAESGAAALKFVQENKPDIVLLEIDLPDMSGLELSKRILAEEPGTKLIVFSGNSARPLVDEALALGACGYVSKRSSVEELFIAISSARAGKLYLSADVGSAVFSDYKKGLAGENSSVEPLLSGREKRLLQLIAGGSRNKEISAELKVGIKSIESYRSRLMKKLKCASSAELVRYAIREGIARL